MNLNFFENFVEQKLLGLHTLYLAKVISVRKDSNNNVIDATVQPLSLIKAYGENAKKQAIIENVPILSHAKSGIVTGSTVCCGCMERDITQTRKGIFALPSLRRHSLSDSIIIGVL